MRKKNLIYNLLLKEINLFLDSRRTQHRDKRWQ